MIKTSIKPIKSMFRMFRVPVSKHWRTALVVLVMAVILVAPIQSVLAVVFCPTGEPVIDLSQCSTGAMPTGIIGKKITEWVVGEIGGIIANSLYYTILVPEGLLLSAAGTFANWMLHSGPITTSTVVTVGWGITRDLANMLFILILLGIALDYILFQSFGVKKALPTLIGVALIINFSLPIAGIFIDFASVFTDFFMGKITGGCGITMEQHCGFTEAIANNLSMTSLFSVNNAGGVESYGGQTNLITDIIFAIFFMAGTIFIFLALGIMFLLRTGYLYGLLILLPLVLALKPLPSTSKYFGQWSSHFIKWTMFAPIASFFLYLSMLIFQANVSTDATKRAGDGFIEQVYTYIIVWFFMLGSLMAAQSMGIKGAGVAMGMIKGAQNWAGGKIKSGAKGVGKKGAAWATRKTGADTKMEKLASGLSKIPGAGFISRGVTGMAVKTKEFSKAGLPQKELDKYKEYSDEQLFDTADRSSGARKAAMYGILAQRGKLQKKGADGTIDAIETERVVTEAYKLNKIHGDKTALTNIRRSSPKAYTKIVDEEWKELKTQNKIVKQKRVGKDGKVEEYDVDARTGKTIGEKKNEAYDIRTSDLENMKGMWDAELMKGFVESGKLTAGFIRSASSANDYPFINTLNDYLAKVSMNDLEQANPGLLNSLKSGHLDEFVIIPGELRGEKNKNGEEKNKGGEKKSTLVDQFGRPIK